MSNPHERIMHVTDYSDTLMGPHTPILDTIESSGTYGSLRLGTLFNAAYLRWMNASTEIMVVMGPPRNGKTYVSSEMMVRASRSFIRSPQRHAPGNEPGERPLYYCAFEDAQRAANDLGFVRDRHRDDAEATKEHYKTAMRICLENVKEKLRPATFFVLEMPGMASRGELVDLAAKTGPMAGLKYNISYALITADPQVSRRGLRQRSKYGYSADRATVIEQTNTTIVRSNAETARQVSPYTGGGNFDQIKLFERSLRAELFAHLTDPDLHVSAPVPQEFAHITRPEEFSDPGVKAAYLQKCFAPSLFDHLGITHQQTFVGMNNFQPVTYYYPDELDRHRLIN
jgi:hypothetical protein